MASEGLRSGRAAWSLLLFDALDEVRHRALSLVPATEPPIRCSCGLVRASSMHLRGKNRAQACRRPARGLTRRGYTQMAARWRHTAGLPTAGGGCPGESASAMKSVVVDSSAYDWEGDRPASPPRSHERLRRRPQLTAARAQGSRPRCAHHAPVSSRSCTILLADLGSRPVEAHAGLRLRIALGPDETGQLLGLPTVSLFAASGVRRKDGTRDRRRRVPRPGQGAPHTEVILDVVYNHTAETRRGATTFGFAGLGRPTTTTTSSTRPAAPSMTAGPVQREPPELIHRLILDGLPLLGGNARGAASGSTWPRCLSRDEQGRPMTDPPTLWDIKATRALHSPSPKPQEYSAACTRSAASSATGG